MGGGWRTLFIVDVELCPSIQLSPLDDLSNMPRVTALYIVVCPKSGLWGVGIGGGLIHGLSSERGGGRGGGGGGGWKEREEEKGGGEGRRRREEEKGGRGLMIIYIYMYMCK